MSLRNFVSCTETPTVFTPTQNPQILAQAETPTVSSVFV